MSGGPNALYLIRVSCPAFFERCSPFRQSAAARRRSSKNDSLIGI